MSPQSRIFGCGKLLSYTCDRCTGTLIPEARGTMSVTAPCTHPKARTPRQLGPYVYYKSSQEIRFDTLFLCNAHQLLRAC